MKLKELQAQIVWQILVFSARSAWLATAVLSQDSPIPILASGTGLSLGNHQPITVKRKCDSMTEWELGGCDTMTGPTLNYLHPYSDDYICA